jgi:ribonuclease D
MVGIDSEWKPYFGTRRNELALIQIASKDQVHILDVCNLGSKCPNLWRDLGLILFANENIIKLGKLTFIFNILIIFLYFIEVICFD